MGALHMTDQIRQQAIDAAAKEMALQLGDDWRSFVSCAKEAISAYEAAMWRPIEEAKGIDSLIDIWIRNSDGSGVRWCDCYYDDICDQWRTSRPSGHIAWIPARFVTHFRISPTPPQEPSDAK
jgi:hypothetical protein